VRLQFLALRAIAEIRRRHADTLRSDTLDGVVKILLMPSGDNSPGFGAAGSSGSVAENQDATFAERKATNKTPAARVSSRGR
jgi:hypothetical protein